jgi:hypothetical protein
LLKAQRLFLLAVIENYQTESDDPAKWEEVKQWSGNIHGLIKAGIRMALTLDEVFQVVSKREAMLSLILNGPPMEYDELGRWLYQYRTLITV